MSNLPALLFLFPFLAAIVTPMVGLIRRAWCGPFALAALAATSLTALLAFSRVVSYGAVRYTFSGWEPSLGIEWLLDGLSGLVVLLISVMALVTLIFAQPGVRAKFAEKIVPFYTLVLLLVAALIGVALSADLFNLFVFLEVASLSAYALVAVGGGRAMLSAFRYLIMGTIGASFYLLGVGYLYASTGTLNMADLALRMTPLLESKALLTGLVFIMVGLAIKMALVPLHGWLPDAYAHAPEPITPLLASLMTKVALYAMVRLSVWVVGGETAWGEVPFMVALGWVGAIAMVAGALLALSERNLKRMFAYGGISHIGLVVLGVSLGSQAGMAGAIFYLINDAVMQAGLFFVAGTIIYRYGIEEVADLSRVVGPMPLTLTALIVLAFSMVGLPPTGGFFGKWYLVLAAMEQGHYVAVGAIVLGTLLTLAYFVRVLQKFLMEERQGPPLEGVEAPTAMRFGLAVVIVGVIGLGLFSDPLIDLIQEMALPVDFSPRAAFPAVVIPTEVIN